MSHDGQFKTASRRNRRYVYGLRSGPVSRSRNRLLVFGVGAFLVLFFSFTVALSGWLVRDNPGLLAERMTGLGKPDQKTWGKVFYFAANVFFLGWC